jgi:hypothetical protein
MSKPAVRSHCLVGAQCVAGRGGPALIERDLFQANRLNNVRQPNLSSPASVRFWIQADRPDLMMVQVAHDQKQLSFGQNVVKLPRSRLARVHVGLLPV